NVDHDGNTQFTTFCPDGIDSWIVDGYDLSTLVLYGKPERLENLDAPNAHLHSLLQTSGFLLTKVRFINTTEIRRKENQDSVAGYCPGHLQVLLVEIVS